MLFRSTAAKADIEEITVTGTRIVRDGYLAPTPVTVAPVEDLLKTTPSSIPDALNQMPQFLNSSSNAHNQQQFASQPTHGNILNLRNLGTTRNLIMFDGLRVPATTFQGTVDVDVLPQLLIQRVDIVTGGASAAYGSDAVSGVVNFMLDKKFRGIKGVVQGGISTRRDAQNYRIGADRKSTRLNSSHSQQSRMPSSA